jgi:hypothetical protein
MHGQSGGEFEGPSAGRGKWSEPGVPHKGWTWVGIEDLEDNKVTCEMCEAREVRYAHYMCHPDYPETLLCGCICAGHMEGNLARAEERDRRMINAARRRANWLTRSGWHSSGKGNPTIRTDGYQVTVFRDGSKWGGVVAHRATNDRRFLPRSYPTVDEARLAAFDLLLMLKEK